AVAGQRERAEAGRGGGRLEQDPLALVEGLDAGALEDAAPRGDRLGEAAADAERGMQREVAPELRVAAEAAAPQERRRLGRAGGDDHERGVDAGAPAVAAAGVDAGRSAA